MEVPKGKRDIGRGGTSKTRLNSDRSKYESYVMAGFRQRYVLERDHGKRGEYRPLL